MTGFGRGTASGDGYSVTVEVQSVNRRNLETTFSIPKEWSSLEPAMVEAVKKAAQRGRVHTSLNVQAAGESKGLTWNEAEVRASLSRFGALADEVGSSWPPQADVLLRMILALQGNSSIADPESAAPVIEEALAEALGGFVAMRATEGQSLADDLCQRLDILQSLLKKIVEVAPRRVEDYREQLMARLRMTELEIDLSDERVLKEIAIFADRCDVAEEQTRLESHLSQFMDTIKKDETTPIGRKLEFILQEILREFNTIGSKSNNLEITKQVIEAKNEIERIREQIQNAE
tara:strand:- start:163 stop:1032 length:870 start_codon:yes stop_codon:yes gene_type:complete